MVTALKNTQLQAPSAPNIPIAPVEYSQQYTDLLNNILRIYFAQLDSYTVGSLTPAYGISANRPTVGLLTGQQFFDTTLGYPIWWNGTKWVNSSGTGV